MPSFRESYFLVPSLGQQESDMPLGSVIADVTTLERIKPNEDLSIHIDTKVYKLAEVEPTAGFIRSGGFDTSRYSAFRRIMLDGLEEPPASASVIEYEIGWVKTRLFQPSAEFIAKAAADPAVKSRLEIGDAAKVFVITGLKTTKIFSISETLEEEGIVTHEKEFDGPTILGFKVKRLFLTSDGEPTIESYVDGAIFEQDG
ncbi:hypothetical protein T069G_02330 [Trichoderma breve]|uniref:Uncharacterized protein n=1 Tax=Trichoderma breve TaxID=2034170 RepID=A0A9W9BKG8_9HYPO|nr:hypothetical protein T069G_02330 [Trichoderma breve]KAJ4861376.1 hypothetical protein T069G_02330 [Trichoderma breve]